MNPQEIMIFRCSYYSKVMLYTPTTPDIRLNKLCYHQEYQNPYLDKHLQKWPAWLHKKIVFLSQIIVITTTKNFITFKERHQIHNSACSNLIQIFLHWMLLTLKKYTAHFLHIVVMVSMSSGVSSPNHYKL